MWYIHPTLEQELAATALLRAQVNLFTHPLEPYNKEESTEETKIHEEYLLYCWTTSMRGPCERCLGTCRLKCGIGLQWTARLESMGWVHFMDPLRPEYSAATEEMLKQLDSCSAESLESQLREDQRSDNGDNETAPLSRNPSRLYLWLARSVAMLR
jgi:hypothetical protein